MTNWVLDTDESPSKSMKGTKSPKKPNWILDEDDPENEGKEGLGMAALMALPRIGSDLLSKGYEGAKQIPEYWRKYKTELPGFWNTLLQNSEEQAFPGNNGINIPKVGANPERLKSLGIQGFAGLNEAINALNQSLPGLAKYGHERLNLLPEGAENAMKKIVPEDTTEDINYLFGEPEHPGEALLRGTARHLPELAGIGKVAHELPHLTKKGATKKLRKAEKLASERDLGILNVDRELIKDAEQYLPNNLPERNLIQGSNKGDYQSLFNLQRDLGKISAARKGRISKLFSPETNLKGEAGLRSRNSLLDAIHENLQSLGHHDISNLLRQGQNDFRRYKKLAKYRNYLGGAAAVYAGRKAPIINFIKDLLSQGGQ